MPSAGRSLRRSAAQSRRCPVSVISIKRPRADGCRGSAAIVAFGQFLAGPKPDTDPAGSRPLNGPRRCRRAAPATVSVRLYSDGMTFTCPVPQAGSHLAELVDRARRSHERIVLTEHGQPAAVLISVDDLDELQRFHDDSDIALCEAINARNEPGVPHDQFMASLDMES
jgi:prevent-host-death family protein